MTSFFLLPKIFHQVKSSIWMRSTVKYFQMISVSQDLVLVICVQTVIPHHVALLEYGSFKTAQPYMGTDLTLQGRVLNIVQWVATTVFTEWLVIPTVKIDVILNCKVKAEAYMYAAKASIRLWENSIGVKDTIIKVHMGVLFRNLPTYRRNVFQNLNVRSTILFSVTELFLTHCKDRITM